MENNNNNNNSIDVKNMEEDVSMDDGIDENGSGSGQRHTTPVEGVDMSQVVSSSTSSSSNGVLVGSAVNGIADPNKNSLVSSTTSSPPASSSPQSSGGETTLLRPGNIIMMTVSIFCMCVTAHVWWSYGPMLDRRPFFGVSRLKL